MGMIVIGGGPAGVEAALTAKCCEEDVILISDQHVGSWKSALPNLWLKNVSAIKKFGTFALPHLEDDRDEWQTSLQNELESAGVKIIRGKATFHEKLTLKVCEVTGEETFIRANKIIIANGSRPVFPNTIKPDGQRIFSYQNLQQLTTIPDTVIVLGESPIGYEMVHLLQQLGCRVTWLLPSEQQTGIDKDIATYFKSYFTKNGVQMIRGPFVKKMINDGEQVTAILEDGKVFRADYAFVPLGFKSNLDNLQLENTDLQVDKYCTVKVNGYGQTCNPNIYIVGDADQSHSAVKAMAQAHISVLHACGKEVSALNLNTLPLSFNEHPQVSTVGVVNTADESLQSIVVPYAFRQFRAYMQNEKSGFLKIIFDDKNVIVGGTCIGEQAKDIISIVSLMVKMKVKAVDMTHFFSAHPSALELPFTLIRRQMIFKKTTAGQ